MTRWLRRIFAAPPTWQQRLGLAGAPWSATGARVLALHIAETSWGKGIGR